MTRTAPHQLRSWQSYFNEEPEAISQLWVCPDGRYFFHYFYPQQVGKAILNFWRSLPFLLSNPNLKDFLNWT